MFEPVTIQDIAAMFNISLEQCEKELQDGIIKCYADEKLDEDVVVRFNGIPLVNPIFEKDLREILVKGD